MKVAARHHARVPTIEMIDDARRFEQMRDEWNALLQDSAADGLFLTWEWLSAWWRHLSEDKALSILAVRSGGALVAIAPLVLRPRRLAGLLPSHALEFLGTGSVGSDYLDFIVRRGYEEGALWALTDYFTRTACMLKLAQLQMHVSVARRIAGRLRQSGWTLYTEKTDVCPYIQLSGRSWPSYLATLGRAHRYNFQRRLKNLTQQFTVNFERACSETQRREALGALTTLHHMRWQHRGGSDGLHTTSLLAFHDELSRLALERGWLRLFVLRLDGNAAAALYGFLYHGRFYFYQSGFDPRYGKQSVGLVAMGLAIKSAIEEGAEEYDLLHGDEAYKRHWAHGARELERVALYPSTMFGLVDKGVTELHRASRKIARHLLQAGSLG